MANLAACWLLIESFVIPDGYFLKWFYLSFYIHPILVFACQIFLWLKTLKRCILVTNLQEVEEVGSNLELVEGSVGTLEDVGSIIRQNQLLSLCVSSETVTTITCKTKDDQILPERENSQTEDWSFCLHKDFSTDNSSSFCLSSPSMFDEAYLNEYSPLFNHSMSSPLMKDQYSFPPTNNSGSPSEVIATARDDEVESEVFYKKYSERMGWFDVLNYDRTSGLRSILGQEVGTPSSLVRIKVKDFSIPYISWNKEDKKKLLKSLQGDFELVYVAQSCLTWEALHHQYRKVKFLTFSNTFFPDNVAAEFQNFQVLLERFLEEERYIYQGNRVWNYVQARFASKSLLQVPKVSGFLEEENEGIEGEKVHAKHVLKAIEKCIQAFGKFVTNDRKRPWWKFKSSLWTYPPVEDPEDLELLSDLTRRLQQKELWLKNLQGKQKCWFKKAVNPVEESQKETLFFTIIEVKLISRSLEMPILSTAQLKWCQKKLDNIVFKRGRLLRTASGPLFPPS